MDLTAEIKSSENVLSLFGALYIAVAKMFYENQCNSSALRGMLASPAVKQTVVLIMKG